MSVRNVRTAAAGLLLAAAATGIIAAGTANAETSSQHNAVRKAESYLEYSGFSREGLIHQLEYEQYSAADAAYAVDHVTVDWFAEAAEKAASYLEYTAFSKPGLIHQLEYEKFTPAQAQYGADMAYGS